MEAVKMPMWQRVICLGSAGCVIGAALLLAALAQEAPPPDDEAPEMGAFVTLGKTGEGIDHTYADIPFRFADIPIRTQLLMVGHLFGLALPRDELPLSGQVIQRVHFMALTAYSLQTPFGTPVGAMHAVYEDGERETLELFEGVDVAEWSYAHPGYGRRLAHARVPPAYDWTHDDPEAGEYPGYTFYGVIETEPRPLDRLELHLNDEAVESTPGNNFVLMINAVTLELAATEPEL
jgi:hypothetical protein